VCPDSGPEEESLNQMSQEPEEKAPELPEPPPVAEHPRFTKPQRVAFVQSAWHREVIEQCRVAFLDEMQARHIERGRIDVFEVPGSWSMMNTSPRP